jgi:hypothetical protein
MRKTFRASHLSKTMQHLQHGLHASVPQPKNQHPLRRTWQMMLALLWSQ